MDQKLPFYKKQYRLKASRGYQKAQKDKFLGCVPVDCSLWIQYLEKAYAIEMGGYFNSTLNGDCGEALTILTGAPTKKIRLDDENVIENHHLWVLLKHHFFKGHVLCCKSKGSEEDIFLGKSGLPISQNFAVLGLEEIKIDDDTTENVIKLRNPWGVGGWQGESNSSQLDQLNKKLVNTGDFYMPFDKFEEYFQTIFINLFEKRNSLSTIPLLKTSNGCIQMFNLKIKKAGVYSIRIAETPFQNNTLRHMQKEKSTKTTLLVTNNNGVRTRIETGVSDDAVNTFVEVKMSPDEYQLFVSLNILSTYFLRFLQTSKQTKEYAYTVQTKLASILQVHRLIHLLRSP